MKTFIKLCRHAKQQSMLTFNTINELLQHEVEYETYIQPLVKDTMQIAMSTYLTS